VHLPVNEDDGLIIEKVLGYTKSTEGRPSMSLVKWKGYTEEHSSWIPSDSVPEEKRRDTLPVASIKLPLCIQLVQNHHHGSSSHHRYSTRRRPTRTDRWDVSNVVNHPSDTVNYVPYEPPEKIDVPTWRVLTEEEQTTVVIKPGEEEESSESELTEDVYYETLHSDQNQRIREMIQRAQRKKFHERKRAKSSGVVHQGSDEDEDMDTQ